MIVIASFESGRYRVRAALETPDHLVDRGHLGQHPLDLLDAAREGHLRQPRAELELTQLNERDRDLQERHLPLPAELLLRLTIGLRPAAGGPFEAGLRGAPLIEL